MIPSIETSNKYSSVPNLLNRLDKMNGNLYKLPVLTTKNSIRIQEKLLIFTVPDFLRLPHRYLSIYSNGTLPGLKF
jgi:hypothetical protein